MVTPVASSLATLLDALFLSAYYPVILLSFSRFFFLHISHLELTRPITLTRSPSLARSHFHLRHLVRFLWLFLISSFSGWVQPPYHAHLISRLQQDLLANSGPLSDISDSCAVLFFHSCCLHCFFPCLHIVMFIVLGLLIYFVCAGQAVLMYHDALPEMAGCLRN